jgi:FAD/FMN-containing dehydrogenase
MDQQAIDIGGGNDPTAFLAAGSSGLGAGALAVGAGLRAGERQGAAQGVLPDGPVETSDAAEVVNDVHSGLNATRVHRVVRPSSLEAIQEAVRAAGRDGLGVSVAGGRHAMGGQQFGAGTTLLDMGAMDRVVAFDREAGEIEVEAGIQWPELVAFLVETQRGRARQWSIRQKQTGADRLSIGGAVSANVHGRGLAFRPFVDDVVSITLVDGQGHILTCSREENAELFRLAVGGYGLFGVVVSVRLRLAPRQKLERVVEVREVDGLMAAFERRIAAGYLYGDFQFAIDPASDDFLRSGVFSCYRPVDPGTPIAVTQRALSRTDWQELIALAHVDKRRAVDAYTAHYLATSGQLYWSDLHQMADYVDGYHAAIDERLGATVRRAR